MSLVTTSSSPPRSSARIRVAILVRLAGGSATWASLSNSTAPDDSSTRTAARALISGAGGVAAALGSGAVVHGAGCIEGFVTTGGAGTAAATTGAGACDSLRVPADVTCGADVGSTIALFAASLPPQARAN